MDQIFILDITKNRRMEIWKEGYKEEQKDIRALNTL